MTTRDLSTNIVAGLSRPARVSSVEAVFLRLLGLSYVIAFGSLLPQILPLIGSHGIVPARRLLVALEQSSGPKIYSLIPSLFWLSMSDTWLVTICALGCVSGAVMLLGFFPRTTAAICYLLYLSIAVIGQPFMNFQWDALLLEAGFLAIFAGAPWLVWAYRFLLFRLIFESGLVKMFSHDPNWRNLHALHFHFFTQPLPNPIAYYAYRLPGWLLDFMTGATLVIEFVAPVLLFTPRIPRYIGLAFLILLQVVIVFTGNYAFFNLLTLALCLWGFDDELFAGLARLLKSEIKPITRPFGIAIANGCLALLIAIGAVELLGMIAPRTASLTSAVVSKIEPFEIVNTYGLFAVMTTTRSEIILEGSDDQVTWKEYSFRYKPGNLHRGLPWVAPYQPRLDWQMWFAALGSYQESAWVGGLMYRLLLGDSQVENLLDPPPFPKPPHYMRAQIYDYQFTAPEIRAKTGAVWQRTLTGTWFGPVSLTGT